VSGTSAVTSGKGAIAAAIALCFAGLLSGACERGGVPAAGDAAASKGGAAVTPVAAANRIDIQDGDRIVWLGDSITHHAQYTQYLETFFVTRYPHWNLEFQNAGIAGDRVGDVMARYPDDAFAQAADLVVVLLGMNDGGFRRYRDQIGDTFRNDLSELLDAIAGNQSQALVVSPTVYDVHAEWRDQLRDGEETGYDDPKLLGYDAVMERFCEMSRKLAADRSLPFADVRSPLLEVMKKERVDDASSSLIPDSLHPSPAGHAIMAVTILREAFEDFPLVSDVRIELNDDDSAAPWAVNSGDAELTDVSAERDANGISKLTFRLLEKSLPWHVPEEARAGFDAADGTSFNRQWLRVEGLPRGRFALSIDSAVVGIFSSSALEVGFDLGKSTYTPQHQQAARVAELNRLRNSGPVRSMQDWRVDHKNRLAAIEAASAETDKAQLLTELDEWLPMFKQAISDLGDQADELWREMREAAQPVKHVYRLHRLSDDYRPFGDSN